MGRTRASVDLRCQSRWGDGMVFTVKLFASFQDGRFEISQLEKPDGARVVNVVDDLRIPQGEIGIMMVDGRHVELDSPLHTGDVLAIFPKIGGG